MVEDCVFCQIIRGEKSGDFVYQGQTVVAFKDTRPQAPVHILVVPKKHIRSVNDLEEEDRSIVGEMIFRAGEIAKAQNISGSGYKLLYNVERGGGQFVFHLHLHLIGGW
jgi:histidine triad (HIT) family protein